MNSLNIYRIENHQFAHKNVKNFLLPNLLIKQYKNDNYFDKYIRFGW